MATTLEALRGINSYPIPLRTLTETAERRGISLDAEATIEVLQGKGFNLCRADLLIWLSYAPDITQGGQSYSFTDEQRKEMRREANEILEEMDDNVKKPRYGYKGTRL